MAAPTIEQVMNGIEARLATIGGLRVSDITPDQINPPQAIVGVPTIASYHATMGRGRFTIEPTVTILVSAALDRVGQLKLAASANPTGAASVVAAVEADKTLGGDQGCLLDRGGHGVP
ncbi:MAG: hypothetical protein L0Y54_10110, partial [Sporichthyaceae bacterium]|nr:hypothetical protein [Sporichthyaceae bacterium]